MTQLQKILAFAQKTGDKVIVTDPEGKEPMVVMPFHMYEHLLHIGQEMQGLTSDQVLQEPAAAPSQPAFSPEPAVPDDLALEFAQSHPQTVDEPISGGATDDPTYQNANLEPMLANKSGSDPEPEEEQFYLEPVS